MCECDPLTTACVGLLVDMCGRAVCMCEYDPLTTACLSQMTPGNVKLYSYSPYFYTLPQLNIRTVDAQNPA